MYLKILGPSTRPPHLEPKLFFDNPTGQYRNGEATSKVRNLYRDNYTEVHGIATQPMDARDDRRTVFLSAIPKRYLSAKA